MFFKSISSIRRCSIQPSGALLGLLSYRRLLKYIRPLVPVAFLCMYSSGAIAATVQINAHSHGVPNGSIVGAPLALEAGTYEATILDGSAWSYHYGEAGSWGTTWNACVQTDCAVQGTFTTGGRFSASNTAAEAFSALTPATQTVSFTLLTANTLIFYVSDNVLIDNVGFINLDITTVAAVPVPAAVWLFCSGITGLIGLASRKA